MKQSSGNQPNSLTCLVNYEDIEIVDYDHFMDENTKNPLSMKYSFLSDYKSSFKGSFATSFDPSNKLKSIMPHFVNKHKSSFESAASIRTSNEIADILRDSLFTKASKPGLIFEFIAANQNIKTLFKLELFDAVLPFLGLRFREKRRDVLEIDRDFARECNLETLRKVLFGKRAENPGGLSDLKAAYRVFFMKVLVEKGCLAHLVENLGKFERLGPEIETSRAKYEKTARIMKSLRFANLRECYDPEGNVRDLSESAAFAKSQMEKIKLFRSFFRQTQGEIGEKLELKSDISGEKVEMFRIFEDMMAIYDSLEGELLGILAFFSDRPYKSPGSSEVKERLGVLFESYLEKEPKWDRLLLLAERNVLENLKLEPLVRKVVFYSEKIAKFSLIFRKLSGISIEKTASLTAEIEKIEDFLGKGPFLPVENSDYIDKIYEINQLKSENERILKELKRFRREKVPNSEFSEALGSILDDSEEFLRKAMKRTLFCQFRLEVLRRLQTKSEEIERITARLRAEDREKPESLEIEDFVRKLSGFSIIFQESELLKRSSEGVFLGKALDNAKLRVFGDWSSGNLRSLVSNFKGPDLKAIAAMNEDIKESKVIFKQLLNVKKLDEELEEERFAFLNSKLEKLILKFRDYKSAFNSNEELREKCEKLYSELIKASSFLMNYYLEKLGKRVLNRKMVISLIDALDVNNIDFGTLAEIDKLLKNIDFIEQNLQENFYHSNKKIALAAKITFLGQSLRLFQRNFQVLQDISNSQKREGFNHKEFFNNTISEFSTTLRLDPLETQTPRNPSPDFRTPATSPKSNNRVDPEEFGKEDVLDSLERYIQRNKSLFDIERQSIEFEKEKKSFLAQEAVFQARMKAIVTAGIEKIEENMTKYEELEGFIQKCKDFKKFFCNVINVHHEYYKYLQEVEKYVNSIDYWLRVFQTLGSSLKGVYKLTGLGQVQSQIDWFSPESLKVLRSSAQELFILSAKAKKLGTNEAVNLFNKNAVKVIDCSVDFLNLLYFQQAGFFEFELVFKELDYKLVFGNPEFIEALDALIKFEDDFPRFLDKLCAIKEKGFAGTSLVQSLEDFERGYQDRILEYFGSFDLRTLRKISAHLKWFSETSFNLILRDSIEISRIIPPETSPKTKILPIINEVYKKAAEIYEKISGIRLVFEIVRKFDSPSKFDSSAKRLVKTQGLNDLRQKFEDMGLESWQAFASTLKGFSEGIMLKQGMEQDIRAELKKMVKRVKEPKQKEILGSLDKFLENNVY